MRKILLRAAAAAVATIAMSGAADAAWIRGGFWGPRVFVGPTFGFGVYAPPLYAPPVYVAPPPVVVQQRYVAPPAPAVAPAAPAAEGSWYYCGNPQGYYPYVRMCNSQWQVVPANPDAGPR